MNGKNNRDNPLRAAGLVTAMGLNIAICMVLGYFVADWLGGSRGWVVLGLVVGLTVGILSCVVLVRKILEDPDG
ncbi:hypothetical protein EBB07_06305 [Paenibacillaceae bacterium]|nr:hypothetical protein EBB07_06305 [Paenibacillaceae bacterium]